MLLLAMDTSTSAITVALHDGGDVLVSRSALDARRHTELLAPTIEAVLQAAGAHVGDLTDVAVGTGPGPFTGLRVGLVTAEVLAHARGIPVHGVCSLDALAAAADGLDEVLVATDARRKEVYWARYCRNNVGDLRRVGEPAVQRPADLPDEVRSLPTVGRGPVLYPEALRHGREPLDVDAGVLAALAAARLAGGEPMPTEPLYLRRPDALTTAERASGATPR